MGPGGDVMGTNRTTSWVMGHETTMNLIGNGLLAPLDRPGEMAIVRSDGVGATVVEEPLRLAGPVQFTSRTAEEDLEVVGEQIRASETLVVMLAACNRDPAVFSRPVSSTSAATRPGR